MLQDGEKDARGMSTSRAYERPSISPRCSHPCFSVPSTVIASQPMVAAALSAQPLTAPQHAPDSHTVHPQQKRGVWKARWPRRRSESGSPQTVDDVMTGVSWDERVLEVRIPCPGCQCRRYRRYGDVGLGTPTCGRWQSRAGGSTSRMSRSRHPSRAPARHCPA